MRFPRRGRKDEDVTITADEALAQSQEALRRAKGRWPEVKSVSGSLRRERLENNWSQRMADLFKETSE